MSQPLPFSSITAFLIPFNTKFANQQDGSNPESVSVFSAAATNNGPHTSPSVSQFSSGPGAFGYQSGKQHRSKKSGSKRPTTSPYLPSTWESSKGAGSIKDSLVNLGITVLLKSSASDISITLADVSSPTSSSPQEAMTVAFIPINHIPAPRIHASNVNAKESSTSTAVCFEDQSPAGLAEIDESVVECLKEIKLLVSSREKTHSRLAIIVYSLDSGLSPSTLLSCEKAGVDRVITFPFHTSRLTEEIQSAMEHASQSQVSGSPSPSISSTITPAIPSPSFQLPPKNLRRQTVFTPRTNKPDRPDQKDLFTISDLSAPFANLCSIGNYNLPRRASVDMGGLALTLSRACGSDGEISSAYLPEQQSEQGRGPWRQAVADGAEVGAGWSEGGLTPVAEIAAESGDALFCELVSEMHLQVKKTIQGADKVADLELLGPMNQDTRTRLIEKLSGWDFKPYELSGDDLYRTTCILFEAVLMTEGVWDLGIDAVAMRRFLLSIRQIYHTHNPYHNYQHGCDVLQATYTFLLNLGLVPPLQLLLDCDGDRPSTPWKRSLDKKTGRISEVFRPQDILTLMLAAIGHDGAHPGLSNAFLKNAKAPLSLVYGDKSALENMHCILIASLLKRHGFGFLFVGHLSSKSPITSEFSDDSGLSTALASNPEVNKARENISTTFSDFRKILFSTILATDMSMHFAFMASLTEVATEETSIERDRILFHQALMKCADISNPCRPHQISEYWSTALLEEWHNQANLELDLRLPVSVVQQADAAMQAKGQVAFIDLFTQPLFDGAATVMPDLAPYAQQCATNRTLWFERLNKLQANGAELPGHALHSHTSSTTIPCSLESHYRTLFPLALPVALLATPPPGPAVDPVSPVVASGEKSLGGGSGLRSTYKNYYASGN
ncbi:hd-domain pdease-like protein [Phaffia rhodozyma]|uniref:Hd-domain pdease-like protein n=1 Tax=Phaffia rhodozyma TaxID=264483 RepID=A0A0F7SEM5_PHARH|nr:hd-domain pdease-like protein [Phaffia rhodozyma]